MSSQNAKLYTPGGRIPMRKEGSDLVLAPRYTEAIKSRVEFIAPRENRCMIQNRSSSIELCHVFARCNSLNQILMKAIEFHLGVELDSMNLDSRWNCFFGACDLHVAFDKGLWGLIPKLEILQDYLKATEADDFGFGKNLHQAMKEHDLDLSKGTDQEFHTYTFLAFNPEYDGLISQFNMQGVSSTDNVQAYPYNKPLIEVKSHVHPKFIILSLGKFLVERGRIPKDLRCQEHVTPFSTHLNLIEALYRAWTEIDDSRLEASQGEFHPHVHSPPPPVSKAALCDAKSFRANSKAGKVVTLRKSARSIKVVANEERGRSGVTPDSNANRGEPPLSIAKGIFTIEPGEDGAAPYLKELDAVTVIDRSEDRGRSAVISNSNTNRSARSPSTAGRISTMKIPKVTDPDEVDPADSDSDNDQLPVTVDHKTARIKGRNQGNLLKRQASSEPNLVDKPLSSFSASSYFNGDPPSSPSPAGPAPTTKRLRK